MCFQFLKIQPIADRVAKIRVANFFEIIPKKISTYQNSAHEFYD